MRSDSAGFQNLNQLASRDPVFVVEIAFDSANTDLHYLCSRAVNGLTGNIINDTLQGISSTSQKISPEKALSTIGTISFECLDIGLTDLQRTKLQAGDGLKGKRIRVYKGFVALDWSDYALIQTQVISDSVSFKDGVYTFQCADVQRVLRKNIFEVKETSLSQSLNASDTVINVYDTSQFEMIKQPSSPGGLTDAPNQTVGYLKIEQGDDVEIIRYSGKTSGTFTGCVRGVLGTKAIDVEVNATEADKSTKVTEYVYLEMAAPKLIYALLTGVQYGQAEGLPEHWHLGVAPEYIKTSDFLNIGSDWWDVSNNDNGVPAVLRGVEKEDGKKFIEEELLIMLGAFMPIYANGEVGLKRMTGVLSQGGFDKELNEDNVVRYGELKHDLGGVINQIIIAWNFVEARDGFTRRSILVDPDSIERNGKSKPLELNLRALETSRHSYSTIKSRFDALRDRYAGAPLRLQLTLAPTENELEIGDIVRVNLPQIEDFTQSGVGLNRNFEVQRVTQDWIKGSVKIDLFGSSAVASPVPEESGVGSEVVDSGFFSSSGTEISPANFGAAVTDVGGVTTVVSNISLTGGSDINSSDSIFYCDQDLTINAGVTVTIISNVQIRAKGFFQLNGKIDGKGRGFTGGLGVSQGASTNLDLNYYRSYGTSTPFYAASNFGTRGFIDPKFIPQRGGFVTVSGNEQSSYKTLVYPDLAGEISQGGSRNAAPSLDLKISGTQLSGLPSDLRGSSGVGGGVCVQYESYFGTYIDQRAGSDGGASGAGLVIVCSGADIGANGVIDTSGEDAAQPSVTQMAKVAGNVSGHLTHSSGTGGACGACYWLIVGASSTAPTLNQSNSVANIGGSKADVNTDSEINFSSDRIIDFDRRSGVGAYRQVRMGGNNGATISMPFYGQPLTLQNAYQSCHKIQYANYASAIEGSVTPVYAEDATFTLTEFVNSPETATQNRCTVEVSITPPSDTEYSYSKVEYRKLGSNQWSTASPSSFESVVEVERDGSTYEFRIRSVSSSNKVSPSGEIKSITVSDIGSFAPDAPLGFAITEELYQTTTSNVIKLRALISWSEPVGKTQRYDVQYRRGSGYWLWVEGNLAGTSASVDDLAVGDHEFRIRPLSVLSQAGDWLTIPYTMLGKVAPPPDIESLFIDDEILTWTYPNAPIDLAGFEVRTHQGERQTWADATPLHVGVITASRFDVRRLVAATTTFLVKAIDTSGVYSESAAIVVVNVNDSAIQNVIYTEDYVANTWPGTISGGSINGSNEIEASQIGTFWNPDENAIFWNPDETALFWSSSFEKLEYEFTYTVAAQDVGVQISVDYTVVGESAQIEYIPPGGGTTYVPFSGVLPTVKEGEYKFKLLIPSQFGGTAPKITSVLLNLDVPDIIERFEDIAISATGTRLPITKTYRGIAFVSLTMQTDGSGVSSLKVSDKNHALGPLVYAYNASGTAVNTTIDAFIRGY